MSNFDDVYQGAIIMVACIVTGIILSMFGGYIVDYVFKTFDQANMFDLPPAWNTMGSTFIVLNIWYFICFLFPVIGIVSFIKTIIRKQGYDSMVMQ